MDGSTEIKLKATLFRRRLHWDCTLTTNGIHLQHSKKFDGLFWEDIIYIVPISKTESHICLLPRRIKQIGGHEIEMRERYLKTYTLKSPNEEISQKWIDAINENLCLSKKESCCDLIPDYVLEYYGYKDNPEGFVQNRKDRIRVIINPHGGNNKALAGFRDKIEKHLLFSGLRIEEELTLHPGHAYELGYNHSPSEFEGVVFVGGDGLANEFINGMMSRKDSVIVTNLTPFTIFPFGSENSLATSIGTNNIYNGLFSLIKRRKRYSDALYVRNGSGSFHYSLCGVVYGIGSDMVLDYEASRQLKILRYPYLKAKWGFFQKREHQATVHYLLTTYKCIISKCDKTTPGCKTCIEGAVDHRWPDEPIILQPNEEINFKELRNIEESELEVKLSKWRRNRNNNLNPNLPDSKLNVEELKNELPGEWITDTGPYYSIAIVNRHTDSQYSHASDGYIDLLLNKTGKFLDTINMGIKYLRGNPTESNLSCYEKVKRVIIEPKTDAVMGIDGEILPLTKVVCIDIKPSLFLTYGEY